MQITTKKVIFGLFIAFIFRFFLSLTIYNGDVNNHIMWMESVHSEGWQGLYERDLSPWAQVNYPPLSLYSFAVAEGIYRALPESLATSAVRGALYKIPSLFADCLIAFLIWRFTPFGAKVKIVTMLAFLFNPALMINSVFWGQIESVSAFTGIAMLIALVKKRGDLAIIAFTLGVLTKQNILPLAPLLLVGVYQTRISLEKLFKSMIISIGLVIFAYLPMIPEDVGSISYIVQTYLSSIGGQSHQHLTTVNALNYWYSLGLNNVRDAVVRPFSLGIIALGLGISLYRFKQLIHRPYVAYLVAAVLISIWTFTFATRMHERHAYMAIAYLTLLLPYGRIKWIYLGISLISFYNTYAVWMEYFAVSPGVGWERVMIACSALFTLITISLAIFPLELLHQDRIKS